MANKTENPVHKAVLSEIKPGDVSVAESRIHPLAFATYIRALLQNWRQGTVGVKGRSDVRHTGKKPWKQKGTGRARAGDSRSPLWRGGGVIFGPQPRTRTLKVSKATKRKVLNTLFHDYAQDGKVLALDWAPDTAPKTAQAHAVLQQAGLADKKIVLFVAANDFMTQASFTNIPFVEVLYFDQPNAYQTAHADYWIFLKKDMDSFTKMVEQWN